MFKPQRPQNLEFCGKGFEQRGHGNESAMSPILTITKLPLPHLPQNFTPSANRELQLAQATMPGMTLD